MTLSLRAFGSGPRKLSTSSESRWLTALCPRTGRTQRTQALPEHPLRPRTRAICPRPHSRGLPLCRRRSRVRPTHHRPAPPSCRCKNRVRPTGDARCPPVLEQPHSCESKSPVLEQPHSYESWSVGQSNSPYASLRHLYTANLTVILTLTLWSGVAAWNGYERVLWSPPPCRPMSPRHTAHSLHAADAHGFT